MLKIHLTCDMSQAFRVFRVIHSPKVAVNTHIQSGIPIEESTDGVHKTVHCVACWDSLVVMLE